MSESKIIYGKNEVMNDITFCFIENRCCTLLDFKEYKDLTNQVNNIYKEFENPDSDHEDLIFKLDNVLAEMNSIITHVAYETGFKEGLNFKKYVTQI